MISQEVYQRGIVLLSEAALRQADCCWHAVLSVLSPFCMIHPLLITFSAEKALLWPPRKKKKKTSKADKISLQSFLPHTHLLYTNSIHNMLMLHRITQLKQQ